MLNLTGKTVIVVGSEGKGLRQKTIKNCDFKATIPMKGKINSLIEKRSQKLGKIKILDFSLSIYEDLSLKIGDVNYIWILPLSKKNEI